MLINREGTKMYVIDFESRDIHGFSFGTPWDFTTRSYDGVVAKTGPSDISIVAGGRERMTIDNDGKIHINESGSASAPAYTFTNDPTTQIWTSGSDELGFTIRGSEKEEDDPIKAYDRAMKGI